MSEYEENARDFLKFCNAKMEIRYIGRRKNEWWGDNRDRDVYSASIHTPNGCMTVKFWDSAFKTNKNAQSSSREYPSEYDILECLQKYSVGTIEEFFDEYGYELHNWKDVKRVEHDYYACQKEYRDILSCFTPDQINRMREIA